jgi:hypothetical protein
MNRTWKAIAGLGAFVGLLLLLPYVLDRFPFWTGWRPWPRDHDGPFAAFWLWGWIDGASRFGTVILIGALLLFRRKAVRPSAAALLVCASAGTVMLYLPFAFVWTVRVDRLRGQIRQPVFVARTLAVAIALTIGLALIFLAVTQLPRTRAITRNVARVTLAALPALLVPLIFLLFVVPFANLWGPADWRRPDLMVPFRPCRDAVLWSPKPGGFHDLGRVDDLWTRFRDPKSGQVGPAVSCELTWRAGYTWVTPSDTTANVFVRKDDPAVVNCDRRMRTDIVEPARWHERGFRP